MAPKLQLIFQECQRSNRDYHPVTGSWVLKYRAQNHGYMPRWIHHAQVPGGQGSFNQLSNTPLHRLWRVHCTLLLSAGKSNTTID